MQKIIVDSKDMGKGKYGRKNVGMEGWRDGGMERALYCKKYLQIESGPEGGMLLLMLEIIYKSQVPGRQGTAY